MVITNIITLNQIISWFNDFANRHYFLKDFGFGETYDIGTSRQMNFPYMWVSMADNSIIGTGAANKTAIPQFSFVVMFLDKINIQPNYFDTNGFNSDNSQQILSDTVQYLQDLITEIQQYWQQYGIIFAGDVSFYPIIDETPDKSTGVAANITFKLKQVNCIIPVSPITPSPTTTTTTIPITPTETPTPTPTPNPVYQYFTAEITGLTQQEVLVECFDTFWNIGPANNLCNWTGEVLITGSTGTVVNPTFTFPIGQQNYTIDLSGSLLPGEIVSNISCCWNVSIPCPNYFPQFISTPISPTPTPTLTPTPTQP